MVNERLGIIVEVRGCPHGVFDPWVRWGRDLESGRCFSVTRRVVVGTLQNCGKCKNIILDESYLEQRWGAGKHVILKRILVRFFLDRSRDSLKNANKTINFM